MFSSCPGWLAAQVRFLPSFTDQQRAALLAACTALVYTPSNEHFGIVPLEAMASGRPVIACKSGGPMESVLHCQTGLLCEPTPEEFAGAMHILQVVVFTPCSNESQICVYGMNIFCHLVAR